MYTTLSSAGTSHSTPLPPNAVVPSPLIYNDSESDDAAKRHSAVINALYEDTIDFEQKIGIIIPSIFAVVVLIGLVGNFLVIVIIALNRQMRNSTNTLIIGLAASDLLFLTLCVPFTAADYALPVWAFPYWWCGMMNYLQHVSAYASVWTLTLMALDRFLAVVFPIQSMTLRSMRNTTVSLVVLYTLIAVSQTPVGLSYGVFTYSFIKEQRSTCAILAIATKNATVHEARAYYMTFNMFGYVVPLGITCVLYYFMLRKLWYTPKPGSQTTRQPTVTNAGGSGGGGGTVSSVGKGRPENIRAKRKVTRMVMGVVIAFAVCWLPLNICFFFTGVVYPKNLVGPGGKWMVIFQIFSQVLAYTNSCLNPILYAFLSDNFRKGFVRIIGYAINKLFCGHLCKEERFKTSNRLEYTNTNNANTNTLSTRSTTAGRGSVSNRASVQMNTISQQRASSFHTISLRTSANESYALLRDRPSMTTVPERKDSKSSRKDSKSSRKDSRGSQCSEKSEDINACGPLPTFEKHRRSRLIALLELSEVDNTSSTISFDSGLCAHLD